MCACFMYEVDFPIGDGHEPSISALSVCLPIKLIVSNGGTKLSHRLSGRLKNYYQDYYLPPKWLSFIFPYMLLHPRRVNGYC
ncbi:MAG: hypothetical protein Q8M99_10060, partial [Methylotenera sp.]|nr:hypothetical protein [Methylotenera sp.]